MEIFAHFNALKIFHGNAATQSDPCGNQHLILRAGHRCDLYYCRDLSNTTNVYGTDDYYRFPLDNLQARRPELLPSFRMARASNSDIGTLKCPSETRLWDLLHSWSTSCEIRHLPTAARDRIQSLTYGRFWLSSDMESRWLQILHFCISHRSDCHQRKYSTTFTFASLVYNHPSMEPLVFMCLVIIANPAINVSTPPLPNIATRGYDLSDGFDPQWSALWELLRSEKLPSLEDSPSGSLRKEDWEPMRAFQMRRGQHWDRGVRNALSTVSDRFLEQWQGNSSLRPPCGGDVRLWLDVSRCVDKAEEYFSSCRSNAALRRYIETLQDTVQSTYPSVFTREPLGEAGGTSFVDHLVHSYSQGSYVQPRSLPTLRQLLEFESSFCQLAPTDSRSGFSFSGSTEATPPCAPLAPSNAEPGTTYREFEDVLTRLQGGPDENSSMLHKLYVDGLRKSFDVLKGGEVVSLIQYNQSTAAKCKTLLSAIRHAIHPSTRPGRILLEAGQWPSTYIRVLLEQLSIHSIPDRTSLAPNPGDRPDWYKTLIHLAECLLEHQRSMRLLDHHLHKRADEFASEVKNSYFNWHQALREPDQLLIQVSTRLRLSSCQNEILTLPDRGKLPGEEGSS